MIKFSEARLDNKYLKRLKEPFKTGWLTSGPLVRELEEKICELTSCDYAVAVNSATAGLHLALEAVGVKGKRVAVPVYTFVATVQAIEMAGGKPIFCDINSMHDMIIKRKFDYIVPVHYSGIDCNPIEKDNSLMIEDMAHMWPNVKPHGLAGVYSFYATKNITAGEGGCIVTNDEKIAKKCKVMRNHGIDNYTYDRAQTGDWEYNVTRKGFKYNMSDIHASLALGQLEDLESLRKERRRLWNIYYERLSGKSWIKLPSTTTTSNHLFYILLDDREMRDSLYDFLKANDVQCAVHYKPIHMMHYYQQTYSLKHCDFPNAKEIYERTLSLPLYNGMKDRDIYKICDLIVDTV